MPFIANLAANGLGMIATMIRGFKLGLVADPVIEATTRLEFEDGLRMEVLPGGNNPEVIIMPLHIGYIPSKKI